MCPHWQQYQESKELRSGYQLPQTNYTIIVTYFHLDLSRSIDRLIYFIIIFALTPWIILIK